MTDVGMLFVRCADGISHHPDEDVSRRATWRSASGPSSEAVLHLAAEPS